MLLSGIFDTVLGVPEDLGGLACGLHRVRSNCAIHAA